MSKPNLLLVDADDRNRRVLEVSLRKAGFLVTTAVDGAEALQRVEQAKPDLVIADTQLPEVDGFTLCAELKRDARFDRIPLILLSAERSVVDRVRGLELGADEYLFRPVFIKEVVARCRMLLDRREREEMAREQEQGTIAGTLAQMSVVDLLQMMELGGKSGVIHLRGVYDKRGAMYFRDGKVIDAELGHLQGENAVYRLLIWTQADFEVDFKTIRRKDVVEHSNEHLLLEGMRRVDEWGRLLEQLPPLDTVFEIDYKTLGERLGEIPDEVNSIIRLFDGRRPLMQVVDDGDHGDVEALEVISKLFFEGLIIDVTRDQDGAVARESRRLRLTPEQAGLVSDGAPRSVESGRDTQRGYVADPEERGKPAGRTTGALFDEPPPPSPATIDAVGLPQPELTSAAELEAMEAMAGASGPSDTHDDLPPLIEEDFGAAAAAAAEEVENRRTEPYRPVEIDRPTVDDEQIDRVVEEETAAEAGFVEALTSDAYSTDKIVVEQGDGFGDGPDEIVMGVNEALARTRAAEEAEKAAEEAAAAEKAAEDAAAAEKAAEDAAAAEKAEEAAAAEQAAAAKKAAEEAAAAKKAAEEAAAAEDAAAEKAAEEAAAEKAAEEAAAEKAAEEAAAAEKAAEEAAAAKKAAEEAAAEKAAEEAAAEKAAEEAAAEKAAEEAAAAEKAAEEAAAEKAAEEAAAEKVAEEAAAEKAVADNGAAEEAVAAKAIAEDADSSSDDDSNDAGSTQGSSGSRRQRRRARKKARRQQKQRTGEQVASGAPAQREEVTKNEAAAETKDEAAAETKDEAAAETKDAVGEGEGTKEAPADEEELDRWLSEDEASEGGHVIPFPAGRAAGREEDINRAAEEAAERDGRGDPSAASINVHDEAFFASDYEPDPYSDQLFADFDDERPRGGRGKWIGVAFILLATLVGAPIYYYGVHINPYFGDGPAHLQVDPNRIGTRVSIDDGKKPKKATSKVGSKVASKVVKPPTKVVETTPDAGAPKQPDSAVAKAAADAAPAKADARAVAATKPPSKPDAGVSKPDAAAKPSADEQYAALISQARALFKKRRVAQAYRLIFKARKLKPDGWEALERLAWRDYNRGRMKQGQILAKKALAGNPKAPYANLVKAAAAHEKGRKATAKAGYQLFLDGCPACPEVRDIKEALKSL